MTPRKRTATAILDEGRSQFDEFGDKYPRFWDTVKWLDKRVPGQWSLAPDEPIDSIDLVDSRRNQSRLSEELNEERVADYTTVLLNGGELPIVVVWQAPNRRARLIVGGNHRTAARLAAEQTRMPMFVIASEVPRKTIVALTMEDNADHGYALSSTERLAKAQYLVKMGMSQIAAAGRMGVTAHDLNRVITEEAMFRRGPKAGVNPVDWERLPKVIQKRLNSITTDNVLLPAAELVIDAAMDPAQVNELVEKINSSTNVDKQLGVIRTARRGLNRRIADVTAGVPATVGKRSRSVRRPWAKWCEDAAALPELKHTLEDLAFDDQVDLLALIREAIRQVEAMLNEAVARGAK